MTGWPCAHRALRVQWIPNLIRSERRICLTRIRWTIVGGYHLPEGPFLRSFKLSISIVFEPRDLWIGLFRKHSSEIESSFWYVCLLPMIPIRFHLKRAWGGIFP